MSNSLSISSGLSPFSSSALLTSATFTTLSPTQVSVTVTVRFTVSTPPAGIDAIVVETNAPEGLQAPSLSVKHAGR